MATISTFVFVAAFVASSIHAEAEVFLGQRQEVTKEIVEQTLFSELASAAASTSIATIKEELRPMYASLPRNEQGQLEFSTVRYALHRYFVKKHGWYVKGLGAASKSSNSTLSAAIMTDLAPSYIQGLFETQLHGQGLKLEELAVFAATLSDLIHSDGVRGLQRLYQALQLPIIGPVTEEEFDLAIRGYLTEVVIGFGTRIDSRNMVNDLEEEAKDILPEYDDLVMWMQDARRARNFAEQSRRNPFVKMDGVSFDQADTLLHDLFHKFGSLTRRECAANKDLLVKAEVPGTGRVPLSRFYAIKNNPLSESADYIRNMGALDETNSNTPMIMISNYLSGPSRCMPFSGYFSVCCPDECENVLGSIEHALGEPSGEPSKILEIVSSLSSDTEPAPRNVSASLVQRIQSIASSHLGRVPLHGRLFMQWLHYAYPRECPYPHPSGTISPVSQEEWLNMRDDIETAMASESEKSVHMSMPLPENSTLETMPWLDVEELVADHKASRVDGKKGWSSLRTIIMLVAVASFALPLVRASSVLLSRQAGDKSHSCLV